jgi:hypothetical protein
MGARNVRFALRSRHCEFGTVCGFQSGACVAFQIRDVLRFSNPKRVSLLSGANRKHVSAFGRRVFTGIFETAV